MKHKAVRKVGYRSWNKNGPIPCIFIQGKMLEGLGFYVGGNFKVDYSPHRIVIETIKNKETK